MAIIAAAHVAKAISRHLSSPPTYSLLACYVHISGIIFFAVFLLLYLCCLLTSVYNIFFHLSSLLVSYNTSMTNIKFQLSETQIKSWNNWSGLSQELHHETALKLKCANHFLSIMKVMVLFFIRGLVMGSVV